MAGSACGKLAFADKSVRFLLAGARFPLAPRTREIHRYSISARIEPDGQLLFISTRYQGVQLNGQDPHPLRTRVDVAR